MCFFAIGNVQDNQESGLSVLQWSDLVDQVACTQHWSDLETSQQVIDACNDDGPALDFIQTLSHSVKESWTLLRPSLISAFKTYSRPLSIREKIDLRKNLKQRSGENVELFYRRCMSAQELLDEAIIDDDEHSETFQRDVLLNFVLGLENGLQEEILASDAFDLGMYKTVG